MDSLHYRILDAVVATINTLTPTTDFPPAARVYKRWLPFDRELTQIVEAGKSVGKDYFPILLVCPTGRESDDESGGTASDKVGYPIQVGIVDANNQRATDNIEKYLFWRQELIKAFRNKRLADMCESYICKIEYGNIIEPEQFNNNLFVSGFTVRCWTQKVR